MIRRKGYMFFILLILGAPFFLASCTMAYSSLPETPGMDEPSAEEPAAMPTATLGLPTPSVMKTPVPRIPEQRRLTLEFPPTIHAGDTDIIRLTLEVDERGNLTPTAEFDGNTVTGETIEVPNLYDTHAILAESRLDLAGVDVVPRDMVSEPLLRGKSVTFYWSVRPEDVGRYRGTVWLHLHFIPNDGGAELTNTVSAQIIEVNVTTFMGLKAGPARWLGAIGSFIGGVLGMPFFEEVVKWLWGKFAQKG